MEKKRIGIVTMYYNTVNYGGALQAYALAKVLNMMGYDAKQISYDFSSGGHTSRLSLRNRILQPIRLNYLKVKLKKRYDAFSRFRGSIPHTEAIYREEDIANTNDSFDVFITGSDQVWNLDAFKEPCFLTFTDKKKIAYAAGLGHLKNDDSTRELFTRLLDGYSAISVRESESIQMLKSCTDLDIKVVLDPTLLLNTDEWDQVASKNRFSFPYLFCYFLGDDVTMRNLAREYAKLKGLKLVVVPHTARFMKEDLFFGDKKMYDASPQDFISLIRNANCIFTDSFHCSVFASMYKKDYYVFERKGYPGMSHRIIDLCNAFNSESHFCYSQRVNLQYITQAEKIEYDDEDVNRLKKESLDFLLNAI